MGTAHSEPEEMSRYQLQEPVLEDGEFAQEQGYKACEADSGRRDMTGTPQNFLKKSSGPGVMAGEAEVRWVISWRDRIKLLFYGVICEHIRLDIEPEIYKITTELKC
jgi:hypothetical protein